MPGRKQETWIKSIQWTFFICNVIVVHPPHNIAHFISFPFTSISFFMHKMKRHSSRLIIYCIKALTFKCVYHRHRPMRCHQSNWSVNCFDLEGLVVAVCDSGSDGCAVQSTGMASGMGYWRVTYEWLFTIHPTAWRCTMSSQRYTNARLRISLYRCADAMISGWCWNGESGLWLQSGFVVVDVSSESFIVVP